jgi:hypothetical protein
MDRRQAPRARSPARDEPDRLVRLIEELRALDHERRMQPVSSSRFRELVRRVEVKAREVFEAAGGAGSSEPDDQEDTARTY